MILSSELQGGGAVREVARIFHEQLRGAVSPQYPFPRLRYTAALVSKKVVKIELATDRSRHRPESKRCVSKPQTKSEVLNRINGSAELYDDQPF